MRHALIILLLLLFTDDANSDVTELIQQIKGNKAVFDALEGKCEHLLIYFASILNLECNKSKCSMSKPVIFQFNDG